MPTTPSSPGWPGFNQISRGQTAANVSQRVLRQLSSQFIQGTSSSRSFVCPSRAAAIIRGFPVVSGRVPVPGPLPHRKIRSMNPLLISSSRPGDSSGNYRRRLRGGGREGEVNVPRWQLSAEYWLGVITVTAERTPTNLTFNNEALVRVIAAWCGIPEQKDREEKERESCNLWHSLCHTILNIYYNLLMRYVKKL